MSEELQTIVSPIMGFEQKILQFTNDQGQPYNVTKYIIKDDQDRKYSFYQTKNGGELTKAYEGFRDMGFTNNGNPVTIVYKSKQRTFVNEQKKTIPYEDRSVMWFETTIVEQTKGTYRQQASEKQTSQRHDTSLESRVAVLETKVAILMGKQEYINTPSPSHYQPQEMSIGGMSVSESVPLPPEPQEISVNDIPW